MQEQRRWRIPLGLCLRVPWLRHGFSSYSSIQLLSVVDLDSLGHAHMRRAASPTAEASWARCWIQRSPACRTGGLITYQQPPSQGGRRPTERTADSVGLYVGRGAPRVNLGVLYGEIRPIRSLCVWCRMSLIDWVFFFFSQDMSAPVLDRRGQTNSWLSVGASGGGPYVQCQTKCQMSIQSKTTLTGIHRVDHGDHGGPVAFGPRSTRGGSVL